MMRNTRIKTSNHSSHGLAQGPEPCARNLHVAAKRPPRLRSRRTPIAMAAAVTGVFALGAATQASAAQAAVDHWSNDSTSVHPAGSEDFCDLGFDVVEHNTEQGNGTRVFRGPVGNYYTWARFTGTTTWSNPGNGHQLSVDYAGSDRDQNVVDNGDGTVTIEVQDTGPHRYSANGTFVFVDAGMTRYRIIIDRKGTPTNLDDDEFVAFLGVDQSAGVRQTSGRDFCSDLNTFLG